MEPLLIIAFLDGRLGHEKQTRGVLQAIADRTPVSVAYRSLPKVSFSLAMKQWSAYIRGSLYRRQKDREVMVDLIIGSGAYTHIPMLLLKKTTGARVITCMRPDRLLVQKIDLCFIPFHDRVKPADNVFITTGPPSAIPFTNTHDPVKGLFLIGGIDKRSHQWNSERLVRQVKTILEREPSMKWTISTSPRTPKNMIPMLEELTAECANVSVVYSETTPSGWIETAYQHHAMVWVTADSISMIYESLIAGCRVGILPVQWKKKDSKFIRVEKELLDKKWVYSYEKWFSGKETEIQPVRLDEAGRCAVEILKRWWPGRLL